MQLMLLSHFTQRLEVGLRYGKRAFSIYDNIGDRKGKGKAMASFVCSAYG